jgi:hypothetical protein
MAEMFVLALMGHLTGDYLLQSKWMALTKSNKGAQGLVACTVHVTIYTVATCAVMQVSLPLFWVGVFAPHWIIDCYSLASHWLKFIRSRTFSGAFDSKDQYREFDIAFTSIVYTVTDNTIHLWCLYFAIKLLL